MITDSLEHARFNMVQQQIRPWEVFDKRVLDTLNTLPRDAFVPQAYQGLAYADTEIPLGHGQQMMFPRIEARMLQALNIKPGDLILEIGTGSGYVTACLASLGANVVSLEIHPELTRQAGDRLSALGITNIDLKTADALTASIDAAPFDVIAVTGSMPGIPEGWQTLLSLGGRMFVVTGEDPIMEANLITRIGEEVWHSEGLFETSLMALENAPQQDHFQF